MATDVDIETQEKLMAALRLLRELEASDTPAVAFGSRRAARELWQVAFELDLGDLEHDDD